MKAISVYSCLMAQMYLKGLDTRSLAEKAGLPYAALRRRMRGEGSFKLEEAACIRKILACEMPLEELFSRKDLPYDA